MTGQVLQSAFLGLTILATLVSGEHDLVNLIAARSTHFMCNEWQSGLHQRSALRARKLPDSDHCYAYEHYPVQGTDGTRTRRSKWGIKG